MKPSLIITGFLLFSLNLTSYPSLTKALCVSRGLGAKNKRGRVPPAIADVPINNDRG